MNFIQSFIWAFAFSSFLWGFIWWCLCLLLSIAEILKQLYYTLIYPFFTYGLITWGNTYITTLRPLIILQKKAIRVITFSDFREHSSPLFHALSIIKLIDLIFFYVAMFMYDFYTAKLPSAFKDLIIQKNQQ